MNFGAKALLGRFGTMSINKKFWRDKRVLITGHTGFKGGWLALWLNELGADVYGYSLEAPKEGFYNSALSPLFESLEFGREAFRDVRDQDELKGFVAKVKPEVVFHLAAQPLVLESYGDPHLTFETNVMGVVNVLESICDHLSVKGVVIVTSDKCYYNDGGSLKEDSPLGGLDPYSCSKSCAELVTASFRESYFKKGPFVATARAGNTIGGGDYTESRLISDILIALRDPKYWNFKELIRSPQSVRPWSHVLDVIYEYIVLAQRLCQTNGAKYAKGWNFGPPEFIRKEGVTVENPQRNAGWILKYICKKRGIPSPKLNTKRSKLEQKYLKLNSFNTFTKLGVQHILTLEEGLDLTLDWDEKYLKGFDMKDVSLQQIKSYEERRIG